MSILIHPVGALFELPYRRAHLVQQILTYSYKSLIIVVMIKKSLVETQEVKPFVDESPEVHYSDGTVSTEYRESRYRSLLESRQRNLETDPDRAAFWLNAVVRTRTITSGEAVMALDAQLDRIDAQLAIYAPTPIASGKI